MSKIKLKSVSRTQGNNVALKEGDITLPDFDLEFEEIPVLVHGFRRMVRELAYDVCEMALTTYICAKAHGVEFTAIPVFLVRDFHHDAIIHHVPSGLSSPSQLSGKRVGVNRGYTVTTGVWARSISQEEYGVDLSTVTWAPSGDEHVEAYEGPANVQPMDNSDLEGQLVSGKLIAAVGAKVDHPNVETMIKDPFEAGLAALRSRELYPINHCVVIRNDLIEKVPDIASQVFDAFAKSKQIYVSKLKAGRISNLSRADKVHLAALEIMDDPLPYGVEPNRHTLESLIDHALVQNIIPAKMSLEELFASQTMDVVG